VAIGCVFCILKELSTCDDVVKMSSWLDILVELSRELVGSDIKDVCEGDTIAVFATGELLVVFAITEQTFPWALKLTPDIAAIEQLVSSAGHSSGEIVR